MNDLRKFLYFFGKLLGDLGAIKNDTIGPRIGRRIAGKLAGKMIGKMFK